LIQKKKKELKDKKQSARFIETAKKIQESGAAENFEKACRAILKEKPLKN
jgi:hypothetical protein